MLLFKQTTALKLMTTAVSENEGVTHTKNTAAKRLSVATASPSERYERLDELTVKIAEYARKVRDRGHDCRSQLGF